MAKTIATVVIAIEQGAAPAKTVRAELALEGKDYYAVTILRPDGSKERAAIHADSRAPAICWLVQRLKELVDGFDLGSATIKVVSDPLSLFPKITYRCPNPGCHTKLFESWGLAPGIRIVCRKCKTLGIPIPEDEHA